MQKLECYRRADIPSRKSLKTKVGCGAKRGFMIHRAIPSASTGQEVTVVILLGAFQNEPNRFIERMALAADPSPT